MIPKQTKDCESIHQRSHPCKPWDRRDENMKMLDLLTQQNWKMKDIWRSGIKQIWPVYIQYIYIIIYLYILVGSWPTPLKNMTSSFGMMKFTSETSNETICFRVMNTFGTNSNGGVLKIRGMGI